MESTVRKRIRCEETATSNNNRLLSASQHYDAKTEPGIESSQKSQARDDSISSSASTLNQKRWSSDSDSSQCSESFMETIDRDHTLLLDDDTGRHHRRKANREYFSKRRKKCRIIWRALENDDLVALRRAALSIWGLVSDDVRRKVWPRLVGVDVYETSPRPTALEVEDHPYQNQVILDVNRSLKRFPPSIEEKQRLAMQDQLVALIMRVLVKHPNLHYYQGYHDICVTFLLVLGEEIGFAVVERLSVSHLAPFMRTTMEETMEHLSYIYPIIGKEKPHLREFLEKSEVGVVFCLSWVITWFGHVLNRSSDVMRLFDLFLASHQWMPLYLSASIVLHREEEILQAECDMANVHRLLTRLPDDLPFENLVFQARYLFREYPPSVLTIEHASHLEMMRRQQKERDHLRTRRNHGRFPKILMHCFSTTWKHISQFMTSRFMLPLTLGTAVGLYAILYQFYEA